MAVQFDENKKISGSLHEELTVTVRRIGRD